MVSPSASVAATVPIVVWFSSPLNIGSEVKAGMLSFKLFSLIETSLSKASIPSVTEITNS